MEKYIADFEGGFISKTENNWKEYLRALILTGKIDSVNMANVVRSFQTGPKKKCNPHFYFVLPKHFFPPPPLVHFPACVFILTFLPKESNVLSSN